MAKKVPTTWVSEGDGKFRRTYCSWCWRTRGADWDFWRFKAGDLLYEVRRRWVADRLSQCEIRMVMKVSADLRFVIHKNTIELFGRSNTMAGAKEALRSQLGEYRRFQRLTRKLKAPGKKKPKK